MNEVDFRAWLVESEINKKVASDCVSRVKKIERELGNCDLDSEFKKDECENILCALKHKGENPIMQQYKSANLPIGKHSLATYTYALKKYINFCKDYSPDL